MIVRASKSLEGFQNLLENLSSRLHAAASSLAVDLLKHTSPAIILCKLSKHIWLRTQNTLKYCITRDFAHVFLPGKVFF